MTNRIVDAAVINHRLDPHETELRIYVEVESLTTTTEIRGRLMGPRCVGSSTIEIAYPLREIQRDGNGLVMRVVIPEASWWEPETPFLYHGVIEHFENGLQSEVVRFHHGIRVLQLTARGLLLNGVPYRICGVHADEELTEQKAMQIRNGAANCVLTSLPADGSDAWSLGDRYGFFVIGTTDYASEFLRWSKVLNRSASAFGWVLAADILQEIQSDFQAPLNNTILFGVFGPYDHRPLNASFAALPSFAELPVPDQNFPMLLCDSDVPQTILNRRDVIGLIKPWW